MSDATRPDESTLVRVAGDNQGFSRDEIHIIDGRRVVFTRYAKPGGYQQDYFHASYCDCGVCKDDGFESQWHRRGIEHPCRALGGETWRPS